ncbi:SPW repeat protein [Streptomyces sp. NPDC014623]|uniref:SPW repeat domain-containing protein n=1 Tax=Streptomyces sp. NPDC014623 TaxID=3364875 RepID=UPI0036F82905
MAHNAASLPSRSANRIVLLHGWREQIISGLMFLAGIALCVAPWIVSESPDAAKDIHRSEVGIAMLVLLVALARLSGHAGKWSDRVIFLSGAWLVASPWLLGLQNTAVFDGAQVFDVVAGTVLLALAAASMLVRAVLDRKEKRM